MAARDGAHGREQFLVARASEQEPACATGRAAKIDARLAGTGMSSDAHDMTAPSPDGQIRAIRHALRSAGLSPYDVTHVNAHAPGTQVGDRVEAAAVLEALGPHPLVTATKSVTGHLIGGAGAVEAIFTVLAVRDGVIPPTRNLDDQDSDVKLEIVADRPRHARIGAAISNSFGFGGHNVVLAFTRPG